jgi:F-type H+-transporting ATPase subunit b
MVTIDINASLIWQIANFLILMVALNFLLYKPIRGMLKQRAEKMAALNGEITASVEGVKSKEDELEGRRVDARRQGVAVAEEMKSEGRAKERELVEAATSEMEQTVAKVRDQIQGEIGQARDQLKQEVQAFGKELAQKILGRSIQ